jgi:hypothetical protein
MSRLLVGNLHSVVFLGYLREATCEQRMDEGMSGAAIGPLRGCSSGGCATRVEPTLRAAASGPRPQVLVIAHLSE